MRFGHSNYHEGPAEVFRFYTRQRGGLVSLDRLPFSWAFSLLICQELLDRVVRGIVPEGGFLVHYLDNFILLSCNRDLLEGLTETVAVRIRQAGFLVSSKSTLSPVQVLQVLGKVVNLRERFIQVQPFVFLQLMVAWMRLATCGYSKKDKLLGTLQWHLRPRIFGLVFWDSCWGVCLVSVRTCAPQGHPPEGAGGIGYSDNAYRTQMEAHFLLQS